MTKTTKKRILKGWIGHKSYLANPFTDVTPKCAPERALECGLLFCTKADAKAAGWDRPSRIELTVRVI